jgi:hypothetical protein
MIPDDAPGCRADGEVIQSALTPLLRIGRDAIFPIIVPGIAVDRPTIAVDREVVEQEIRINFHVDCVFFLETMFDHSALMSAKHRIFIPNPEWILSSFLPRAKQCNHVWHKSRFSLDRLTPVFPNANHVFVGFTSPDPGRRVVKYDSFIHPRGHIYTLRNTNTILQCWKARRDWPNLYVLQHGRDPKYEFSDCSSNDNIHLRLGWLERDDYLRIVGDHGIHLCTSEVEGFGHYINEARAMGGLVVTVDGPPMNELVDVESGILVKPSSTVAMNFGTRYLIDAQDMASAIDRVLGLDLPARQRLGEAARDRYENEDSLFRGRLARSFDQLRSE